MNDFLPVLPELPEGDSNSIKAVRLKVDVFTRRSLHSPQSRRSTVRSRRMDFLGGIA